MVGRGTAASPVPAFGPLEGVRVLDLGRFVAGPWAATHLGEFGAEVIHVETPPFGLPYADPTRTLPPTLPVGAPAEDSVSESWVQYSRNKLSVGLDFRRPEGRELLLRLAGISDILIESSRPGSFEKMDLGDDVLWAVRPDLTIVHVSGFGRTGEAERIASPSYDLIGQAYSGYLSLQGFPDPQPPMRAGTALNDTVTGLAAAGAALMGYISARRTGRGQAVDVAQYEVFFTLLENVALDYFARGVERGRHGTGHARLHPYDVLRARDAWVVVAAPTADSWKRLREVVGLPSEPWDAPAYRESHRGEVDEAIRTFCSTRSAADLEEMGRARDIAILRVRSMRDLAEDPHYLAREMFVDWTDPVAGRVRGAGIAPKFSRTPGQVWRGAPQLGQDNALVLGGLLGLSPARIDELVDLGVVGAVDRRPAGPGSGVRTR